MITINKVFLFLEYKTEDLVMAIVIQAKFQNKLSSKLDKFEPGNADPEYNKAVFAELFELPQFKAHVAAYVDRNYCVVINDEDHPTPESVLAILTLKEIRKMNEWIVLKNRRAQLLRR
jgi:hypothetical protein